MNLSWKGVIRTHEMSFERLSEAGVRIRRKKVEEVSLKSANVRIVFKIITFSIWTRGVWVKINKGDKESLMEIIHKDEMNKNETDEIEKREFSKVRFFK